LAKMSSNEKILLTAPQSAGKQIYAQENAKILNRVEIIRVPEEFQEEYDKLYKGENKTVASQSVVESEEEPKKVEPKDETEQIVSEHKNPFQHSKKQESVGEDTVVDAYFNPFGRPFVVNTQPDPVPSLEEDKESLSAEDVPLNKNEEVSKKEEQDPSDSDTKTYSSTHSSKVETSVKGSRTSFSGPPTGGLNIRQSMIVD